MWNKSAKFGIGLSLLGFFSQLIVGILPMTIDWIIPPIIAKIIVIVGFTFMLVGLGFILSCLKKSSKTIKEQKVIIKDQENSLRVLRRNNPHFSNISSLVDKMDGLLRDAVDTKVDEVVNEDTMADIFLNWAAKMDLRLLRFIPKPSSQFRWAIWFYLMSIQMPRIMRSEGKTLSALYWLGGEMDERDVGLKQIKETTNYKELLSKLKDVRGSLGNEMLNDAIEKYLLYSYSLNSLLLFFLYSRKLNVNNRLIPRKFRLAVVQVKDAFDIIMSRRRNEIAKYVEMSLIGK